MREVLDELLEWWESGATVGRGHRGGDLPLRPASARAPRCSWVPTSPWSGSVSGGCVEGAVYELAREVVDSGAPVLQRYGVSDDDAFAVGLTCGGVLDVFVERVDRESFPELGEIAADVRAGRPVAIATVVSHPDPARIGRRLLVRPRRRHVRPAVRRADGPVRRGWDGRAGVTRVSGSLGSERVDDAVRDDALGLLAAGPQRRPDLRARRGATGRGSAGLRPGARPAAPDAGLRRHRLRRRGGPGGVVPRLPGDGVRRAAPVRDAGPVPRRRRGGRRLAAPLPAGGAGGRPGRRADGALRAHPRPQVRRPAARGRPAVAGGRLRRRHGVAPHAPGPARAAARGGSGGARARRAAAARSAWTWGPGRRRRPRSASPPRSSRLGGAGPESRSPRCRGGSTAPPTPSTPAAAAVPAPTVPGM